MELTGYALDKLRGLAGVTVYGPLDASKQVGVISFNLPGLKPEQVAYLLDTKYDIMVRAGLHCAPPWPTGPSAPLTGAPCGWVLAFSTPPGISTI